MDAEQVRDRLRALLEELGVDLEAQGASISIGSYVQYGINRQRASWNIQFDIAGKE